MIRLATIAMLCAASIAGADTLDTLKAQNALRPRNPDDVTLGQIVRNGEVRRMAPARQSPGKLVRDNKGELAWQTPDGSIVPAKQVAMKRDPSDVASARADLEDAILEAAGAKHGTPEAKASALSAAAKEARKGTKAKDAAAGAGLLALGALLGRATRRA